MQTTEEIDSAYICTNCMKYSTFKRLFKRERKRLTRSGGGEGRESPRAANDKKGTTSTWRKDKTPERDIVAALPGKEGDRDRKKISENKGMWALCVMERCVTH